MVVSECPQERSTELECTSCRGTLRTIVSRRIFSTFSHWRDKNVTENSQHRFIKNIPFQFTTRPMRYGLDKQILRWVKEYLDCRTQNSSLQLCWGPARGPLLPVSLQDQYLVQNCLMSSLRIQWHQMKSQQVHRWHTDSYFSEIPSAVQEKLHHTNTTWVRRCCRKRRKKVRWAVP